MTTDWKALCADLARVLELSIDSPGDFDVAAFELIYVARRALAQPEPEGPARWGRPTPQPADSDLRKS